MKNKKKKRCQVCLLFYSEEKKECPYCGCNGNGESIFSQPYNDALPLCSTVESLRIGRAVTSDKNCISYIGLDIKRNKRILIREFFPRGYVRRHIDGQIVAADPAYSYIIEQYRRDFLKGARHSVSGNGTVYTYRRLIKKRIVEKQTPIFADNIASRSIVGSRANQEDAAEARVFDGGMCAVLCDGMGGIGGGEIASAECVRIMMEISDTVRLCDEGIIPAVLRAQAAAADRYISALQDADGSRLRCGTTLVYVAARDDRMYFACAGDSHIYLIFDDVIRLITEEHNYLADLMRAVRDGDIDREDALNHPKRDALTSYIGIGNIPKLQVSTVPVHLRDGESVLMCSDGLYRALGDDEILRIISNNTSVSAAADALISAAEERALPKQDNATLIIYKHSGGRKQI